MPSVGCTTQVRDPTKQEEQPPDAEEDELYPGFWNAKNAVKKNAGTTTQDASPPFAGLFAGDGPLMNDMLSLTSLLTAKDKKPEPDMGNTKTPEQHKAATSEEIKSCLSTLNNSQAGVPSVLRAVTDLRWISVREENRQQLEDSSFISDIMMCLLAYTTEFDIQEQALQALANMLQTPEIATRVMLGDNGTRVLSTLIQTMRKVPSMAKIQQPACLACAGAARGVRVLPGLAAKDKPPSPKPKKRTKDLKMSTEISLLSTDEDSQDPQDTTTTTTTTEKKGGTLSGGTDELPTPSISAQPIAKAFSESPLKVKVSLHEITELFTSCVGFVLAAMHSCETDAVHTAGCTFFCNLTTSLPHLGKEIADDGGVLVYLCRARDMFTSHSECAIAVCKAATALCDCSVSACQQLAEEHNGVENYLDMIDTHNHNPTVISEVAVALLPLISYCFDDHRDIAITILKLLRIHHANVTMEDDEDEYNNTEVAMILHLVQLLAAICTRQNQTAAQTTAHIKLKQFLVKHQAPMFVSVCAQRLFACDALGKASQKFLSSMAMNKWAM
eukprot:TRINITY_DN93642_c0_g1_i1.p1 TRINITY_DN93642_c0_g1~~TRINITY_DN93642_c0_g1_i1.p1  ORF type:complete len:557 (-),score=89.46 TRINITY_DN93642_c0_g1_i1:127-1797(-)